MPGILKKSLAPTSPKRKRPHFFLEIGLDCAVFYVPANTV